MDLIKGFIKLANKTGVFIYHAFYDKEYKGITFYIINTLFDIISLVYVIKNIKPNGLFQILIFVHLILIFVMVFIIRFNNFMEQNGNRLIKRFILKQFNN